MNPSAAMLKACVLAAIWSSTVSRQRHPKPARGPALGPLRPIHGRLPRASEYSVATATPKNTAQKKGPDQNR